MDLLAGRTAVVTGGAQGIGAELALGLAAAGAAVAIADMLEGSAVADRIAARGGRALAVKTDITDDASLAVLIEQTCAAFGGIDILVNNAALFGTLPLTPLDQIENDAWDRVMRVNARGPWQCVKAVLPSMISRGGGSIVNIATNRVFKGYPSLLHYDASKGAVVAMTKALAAELGVHDIRVNALAPGLTLSENVLSKPGIEGRNEAVVGGRALKRSQTPADIVGAALFFASDLSRAVTGQTLVVDGGGVMH